MPYTRGAAAQRFQRTRCSRSRSRRTNGAKEAITAARSTSCLGHRVRSVRAARPGLRPPRVCGARPTRSPRVADLHRCLGGRSVGVLGFQQRVTTRRVLGTEHLEKGDELLRLELDEKVDDVVSDDIGTGVVLGGQDGRNLLDRASAVAQPPKRGRPLRSTRSRCRHRGRAASSPRRPAGRAGSRRHGRVSTPITRLPVDDPPAAPQKLNA